MLEGGLALFDRMGGHLKTAQEAVGLFNDVCGSLRSFKPNMLSRDKNNTTEQVRSQPESDTRKTGAQGHKRHSFIFKIPGMPAGGRQLNPKAGTSQGQGKAKADQRDHTHTADIHTITIRGGGYDGERR